MPCGVEEATSQARKQEVHTSADNQCDIVLKILKRAVNFTRKAVDRCASDDGDPCLLLF